MQRKTPKKHVHACYYCKKPYRISRMYVTYFTGWEHNWKAIPPEWVEEQRVDTCPVCYGAMGYFVKHELPPYSKRIDDVLCKWLDEREPKTLAGKNNERETRR